jgi:methylated-DNA-[protein]-cysteine S-methyltransferase
VLQVIERVQQHLSGNLQHFTAEERIDWSRVSEFQRAVYREALAIKPGFKRSYGDISRALSLGPEGARAVGTALATNPWPLLVPCHRVVSSGDKMTGFSAPGGIRTKTRLLVLEGAELLSE